MMQNKNYIHIKDIEQNVRYLGQPPNESRSNLVSLESLVGICGLFSANAFIHFPRELSERFINLASSSKWPSLPAT